MNYEIFFNNGDTPVIIVSSLRHLDFHTPREGDYPWKIINENKRTIKQYTPKRRQR